MKALYDVVDLGANAPRRFAAVRHPAPPDLDLARTRLEDGEAARTADRLNHEAKRRARTARRRRNRQLTEDEQRKRREALLRSQRP